MGNLSVWCNSQVDKSGFFSTRRAPFFETKNKIWKTFLPDRTKYDVKKAQSPLFKEIVPSESALLMIFGSGVDLECAVDLLAEHDPRQLMREGHG